VFGLSTASLLDAPLLFSSTLLLLLLLQGCAALQGNVYKSLNGVEPGIPLLMPCGAKRQQQAASQETAALDTHAHTSACSRAS
jgi:hypothetical protein